MFLQHPASIVVSFTICINHSPNCQQHCQAKHNSSQKALKNTKPGSLSLCQTAFPPELLCLIIATVCCSLTWEFLVSVACRWLACGPRLEEEKRKTQFGKYVPLSIKGVSIWHFFPLREFSVSNSNRGCQLDSLHTGYRLAKVRQMPASCSYFAIWTISNYKV